MKIITIDFETYWSLTYSVSKMSPLEYVMGDEYETISCAIQVDGGKAGVFFGHEAIAAEFARLDIPANGLLAHNMSGFDCYIAAYRFHLKPKLWMCTKAMSQPINSKTVGNSLAQLVKKYNVGVKNNAILMATKGKHLEDFTEAELADMAKYNGEDTEQCYRLFKAMRSQFTTSELWHIDATIRMRTEPAFVLDRLLLTETLKAEKDSKRAALLVLAGLLKLTGDTSDEESVAEAVRAALASAPQFSKLLEARGVETPLKPSPSNPDKQVPALAKTDEAFLALQESDDPVVSTAATTRLAIKSTLLETRIGKLLSAEALAGGRLPVPIRYCGADTTGRDSGEEYNLQNLPRIGKTPKRSDALRKSIMAPKGHKIMVADQSGIELRVNHTLWQVPSSMALWKEDPQADLYQAFAALRYAIDAKDVTAYQRQLAKIAQLGLGFGAGVEAYRTLARTMGGLDLSVVYRYMSQHELDRGLEPSKLDDEGFAMAVESDPAAEDVRDWRGVYTEIVDGWKTCHAALPYIQAGEQTDIDPWGLCHTVKDAIVLPSGRLIRYPGLREELEETREDGKKPRKEWWYGYGRHKARIYAGKIDENIVQALARDSIFDAALTYYRDTGLRPQLKVHDELVYVVEDTAAPELLAHLQSLLRTPPKWWPQLTVWSEGDIAERYGDAK